MSDLRMELMQGQLNDIEENVRSIKATWGNTIMTLDNIKTALRTDRQKAIDEAYNNGFEAGSHEATTLEYQRGLEDGKKQAKAQAELDVCHDIEKVAREHFQKGLEDAWECAKKLFSDWSDTDIKAVFPGEWNQGGFRGLMALDPKDALDRITRYEQKQKEDAEIKVGDEVIRPNGKHMIVVSFGFTGTACGFDETGCWTSVEPNEATKTGNHYDIAALLEKMKGE